MGNNKTLEVLVLEGTARERGRAHGEALRDLIHEHHLRWVDALQKQNGMDEQSYLDALLAETDFMPAIERWTPDLLEEVRGIAEGANVDFRYAFARQLSDEEPWFRREMDLTKKINEAENPACSSIGLSARDERSAVIGQNMDTPTWYDGLQVLLHLKGPDMPVEVFNFSLAGKINLCGMNSNGLAICCNTLAQLDYARNGLPEDYVVRGFLAQENLAAGLDFMNGIKHASGQNYTIAEPGSRAINIEASANSIAEYLPFAGADRVYHTNHPLKNKDQGLFRKALVESGNEDGLLPSYNGSTMERFAEFQHRLADPAKTLGVSDMKAAFSSHSGGVCRHPDEHGAGNITLGCLIMDLGATPSLQIAPGPPCTTPFVKYLFQG